ncbi:ATP-dependent nuclease [Lysinibacillus fusiformis]|uniref:ATP-dependent nuclease n=1 Tax=Lysinibacillus fusiformis TaxID=28031 RepID=UPI003CFC690E
MENYKSIKLINNLPLHNKVNILAGKNNTGKTALIEVIYKILNAELITEINEMISDQLTSVNLEITVDSNELQKLNENLTYGYKVDGIDKFIVKFYFVPSENAVSIDEVGIIIEDTYYPLYTKGVYSGKKGYKFYYVKGQGNGTPVTDAIPQFLINIYSFLKEKIIFISGSRHVPGKEEAKLDNNLNIDGTNLNAFLYTLRNNEEAIFENIKDTFMKIFNDVLSISTPISSEGETNISIRFEGLDKNIPLSNCGSGYTHVLLFLCVLYTRRGKVVLFDEPQIFLHPSAEKAIYDLINEKGEQQYLLTTHSPILINYPFEKNLIYVKKKNSESEFLELKEIQEVLSDIGIKNSDFALSEKIIFVEGETEEVILPVILKYYGAKQLGYNFRILRMNGTGNDFTRNSAMTRNKEKIDQILGQIASSPIPYRILIDMDEKNEEKIHAIQANYGENVIILDRREFENYFLECYQEIATVISEETGQSIDCFEIQRKVESLLALDNERKLFPRLNKTNKANVVGSEVLERIFKQYSIGYNKIKHGLRITELTLENNAEQFVFFKNELLDFVID